MARATVPKVREVVDELPALQCDLCDFVFSVVEALPEGYQIRQHPDHPLGSGRMFRSSTTRVSGSTDARWWKDEEIRDLCPTCMQAIWDDVTKRREKLLSDRAASSPGRAPPE